MRRSIRAWDRIRDMVARVPKDAAGGSEAAIAPLRGAALAAGLLDEAWAPASSDDPLRAEVVRELARGLKKELEALAGTVGGTALANVCVEGALRAADVANLAASSLAELSGQCATRAAAAAHLAAGAARALCVLAAAEAIYLEGNRATYVLKDAQGAAWRAGLAVRQADKFLEGEG